MGQTNVLWIRARTPGDEAIEDLLSKKGFTVATVHTGRDAAAYLQQEKPVFIILDAGSLRLSGERIIRVIRAQNASVPIVLLKNAGQPATEQDVAVRLMRPFSARRFLNALQPLCVTGQGEVLELGDLQLDLTGRTLTRGIKVYHLTPKQAQLLEAFMRRPGDVLSRRFLMKQVWNTEYLGDTRTLEVHIRWLRKFVETNPDDPHRLTTVRGIGYRLDVPQQDTASLNGNLPKPEGI